MGLAERWREARGALNEKTRLSLLLKEMDVHSMASCLHALQRRLGLTKLACICNTKAGPNLRAHERSGQCNRIICHNLCFGGLGLATDPSVVGTGSALRSTVSGNADVSGWLLQSVAEGARHLQRASTAGITGTEHAVDLLGLALQQVILIATLPSTQHVNRGVRVVLLH